MQNRALNKFRATNVLTMRKAVRTLISGDLQTGWEQYKYRNFIHWFDRRFNIPYWEGESVKGKRLLLMYEQGLGEQIFFASVIPDIVALGAKVILEVDERLVSIMARSFPEVEVIPYQYPWHDSCYTADVQCFLGTAMKFFRPTLESFPKDRVGYLKPDPTRVQDLVGYDGRIGLSWCSAAQSFATSKSVPVELFAPLLEKRAVVSLQYGATAPTVPLIPRMDITQDIENCAALASICSSIVTVSNATAHLAGALGRETYVLVPNGLGRHFYWYPEREYVPNYPSAGAYMQMPANDWKPCVDYITKKLLDK